MPGVGPRPQYPEGRRLRPRIPHKLGSSRKGTEVHRSSVVKGVLLFLGGLNTG